MNAPYRPDLRFEDWKNRALQTPIAEVAMRLQPQMKRNGTDLSGPCPRGCASHDGLVVTPRKSVFVCRPSGAGGDVIELVKHAFGCEFVEALEFITGEDRPDSVRPETDAERSDRQHRNRQLQAANEARQREQERAAADRRARNEEAIGDVLARAKTIEGTHAEAYLRARDLAPASRLTGDLRYIPDLDYWGQTRKKEDKRLLATLPAMVGIVRDALGSVTGIHRTFLDPKKPAKWIWEGERDIAPKERLNPSKRCLGDVKGGMIRLGMTGERLMIGEGIETTLAAYALGIGPEDVTIGCGISLGNMVGGWTGSLPHPTRKNPQGKPTVIPNAIPDDANPGVILPDGVQEVYLLGDGDSDEVETAGKILTAARRYRAQGKHAFICFAPPRYDFSSLLSAHVKEMAA